MVLGVVEVVGDMAMVDKEDWWRRRCSSCGVMNMVVVEGNMMVIEMLKLLELVVNTVVGWGRRMVGGLVLGEIEEREESYQWAWVGKAEGLRSCWTLTMKVRGWSSFVEEDEERDSMKEKNKKRRRRKTVVVPIGEGLKDMGY